MLSSLYLPFHDYSPDDSDEVSNLGPATHTDTALKPLCGGLRFEAIILAASKAARHGRKSPPRSHQDPLKVRSP